MQQTVYADVLLSVNLLVDYFLLLSVKTFFSLPTRRIRLVLGALFGAFGSFIILLPDLSDIVLLFFDFAVCLCMVLCAFMPIRLKKIIQLSACLYGVSFAYAGAMLVIWRFFMPEGLMIHNSVVYFDISPVFLAVLTVVLYFVFKLIGRITGKKEDDDLFYRIEIAYKEKRIKAYGKIDTGSTLKEPFSGDPVIVVCSELIKCFGEIPREKMRVIPYSTISGEGMLNAFRPDMISLTNGKRRITVKNCYVAAFDGIFEEGHYEALINSQILLTGREERT